MAYEFLKKLFGTPAAGEQPKAMTYAELEAAIDADKGLSLVNLKDGGYVSKDKFDAKETELKGVQAQLATASETIKGFEGQDVEGIKKKVSEWETKYTTDTQALKDQLAAQARAHAEEMFLSGYQFTSKAARSGILAELRAKEFKIEDGTLLGGKEWMDSMMVNEDYKGAFVPPKSADEGKNGVGASGAAGQNRPKFSTGTNGGAASGGDKPPFSFGFIHVREPDKHD